MFEQITKKLKRQYYLFWLLPILLVIAYETNLLTVGLYADDVRMQYIGETIGILIAMICVPVSLKLFKIALRKRIDATDLTDALTKYVLWSGIRLGILEIAVLPNVILYYLTLNNVGAFCALIALTASVFCLPSEKRLREELNVTEN